MRYRDNQLSLPFLCTLTLIIVTIHACAALEIPTVIRGSGSVLLMPEPGPLTMTFKKRDLNIYEGADAMPVSVQGPFGDETVAVTLPDDGNVGKGGHGEELQQETVTVDVERRGLWRVVFSGGDNMFGMSANCDLYVVQSGLLFNDPNTSANVHFAPPEGEFDVTAAALHNPGRQSISLHDAAGDIVHEFDLAVAVEDVPYTVAEGEGNREGLWYWQVGKMDVDLSVEGVRYWTPEPASYFDPQGADLRLTPRKTARYLTPGETADYRVLLFPPAGYTGDFEISITQPEQPGVRFELADPEIQPVTYADNRMVIPVSASAQEGCVPGDEFDAYLEVTASENPLAVGRTWLQARIGQSPASEPLDLPIVLEPFEHEGWQFGYAPEFEPNSAYFDLENRAWIRHRTEDSHWSAGAQVLSGDQFVLREWTEALQENHPGYQRPSSGSGFRGARWAFDDEGGAWTTMRLAGMPDGYADAIIYTPDRGQTWQSHVIDANSSDIEWFTGHNDFDTPPVVGYRQTAPHPATYAGYYDLLLYLPHIEDGRLTVPEPILITDNCFGNSVHSGAPPALATRDGRTHIVWGEITDPEDPGVPTYVATYDHASGSLSEKVFIAFAPPVNDVHNTPAIVLDSEGYIHVVTGAHGNNFYYARSLEPNTVSAGFTEAVKVHDAGWIDADTDADGRAAQTYIGLVCDRDDTLHLIYRHNRKGLGDYLTDYGYYMGLSYQRKPKGEEWSPVQPLVIPPVGGYSIYYHKLTIDRTGGLWVAYNHWTNHAYQNAFPERYHHRAMITSNDGGDTWRLARTEDFVQVATAYEGR